MSSFTNYLLILLKKIVLNSAYLYKYFELLMQYDGMMFILLLL